MKRHLLSYFFCACMLAAACAYNSTLPLPCAEAGRAVSVHAQEQSGTTLYVSTTGVSHVMTIDLTQASEFLSNIYTLSFPPTVTLADTSAAANTTGNAATATAEAGITYFYITTDAAKTAAQLEKLNALSQVTKICSLTLANSATPWTTHRFEPEPGRYVHILAQSGGTNVHRPGALVTMF